MKKIFTLVCMAMAAMSMNAQTQKPESYLAVDQDGNMAAEFAAVVTDGVANNVENGNSVVKFGTTNVEVEAVSSGTPANKTAGVGENKGQDLEIGEKIGENMYKYTVLSTEAIKWNIGNRGDISYYWIQGTGVPAVSAYAEEIITDGVGTGTYRLAYEKFDPAVGGLPVTGLYYKITTKVDGALKIGIWANKGSHATYVVDAETKQVSDFLVEGYINGQTYKQEDVDAGNATTEQIGKMKYLSNDDIKALGSADKPYVIGAGNQPFFGNLIVDAKAGKTYYFFQGTTQIGFNGYTFAPGAKKEDLIDDGIETIKAVAAADNANAPVYNLAGQQVNSGFKGLVIKNGKKFVVK